MSFVHLAVHSEYSLIDSTIRVKALVKRAAELDMPAVAITDQSNLFALVKFFRAAEAAGVKPIAGADLWVSGDGPAAAPDRLIVLCQNREGYATLSRLLSRAYLEREGRNLPVVHRRWLAADNRGLIALAGLTDGEVGRLLLEGKPRRAREAIAHWSQVFSNRFYVDIARTGRESEERHLEVAIAAAHECACPVVATNDVRFLERQDFAAHEARVCIHDGRILNDPKRPRRYSDQQYLRSGQEMAELFRDLPVALDNAREIAKRCNLALELGTYYLPEFPLPAEQTVDSYLREQSEKGLRRRLQRHGTASGFDPSDYSDRLDLELGVISQMGFPGYFLIVADFILWAKDKRIPVGPGRGSGAGSLVAYALGITDLDPLRYDLLFERFLNPERVSLPDFDVDFCMDRRDEVIDYVAAKYGRDRVCQIITFGSMAARAVVRDTGRVLGHPYGFVDSVAKLIPLSLGITLDGALAEEKELRERAENEEEVGELLKLARALEGLARNAGKHAGGVVIAPRALAEFTPLYCEPSGDSVVTQFDKDDVEAIGLVKFDFLGLRTLTIIDWAVAAINHRRAVAGEQPLDPNTLPMDDAKTFELLKRCDTTAVFQLESRGIKDLVRRLQPEHFDDIVALVALFRPGPLDSGMVDTYVNCKHGRSAVRYPHPKLEPILKPTYGVILYQEQVMQIAQVLAGYTLGGADILRRAMGKKKPEEMAKQRAIFVSGAVERGIGAALAESIFDLMEKFAGYGFNKSHSAAYALLAYQTAYLKAHYPAEFMAAVLSADMDNTDKVVTLIDDAKQLGLVIVSPDVNRSGHPFIAEPPATVIYGLGAIKGVGRGAVETLVAARERDGAFSDLLDFCRRVDLHRVNRRVVEALIVSGAMDSFGDNRASLMHGLPDVLRAAEQESRDRAAGQVDLFGTPAPPKAARVERIAEWSQERLLRGERESLGLYLSGHPIDPHLDDLSAIVSCRLGDVEDRFRQADGNDRRGQPAVLAGLIIAVRRRGERSAYVLLDDQTGRIEIALFREALADNLGYLNKDQIVVAEGNLVSNDFSGGLQLRTQRLFSLDEAFARYAQALRVVLDSGSVDLARLKELLAAHQPGDAPVVIQLRHPVARARVRLGEDWRIRPARELTEALAQVPGVEAVRLVYANQADAAEAGS